MIIQLLSTVMQWTDGILTISPSTSTDKGIFMVLVDGEESDDAEINGNTSYRSI